MQCASCHGAHGEGVADEYPAPLKGDLTAEALAKLIDESMPLDDPSLCTGESAKQVADYVYRSFYGQEAQAAPGVRIELARLTVRQYVHTVADLMTEWTGQGQLDERRGLSGTYYSSAGFNGKTKAFERIDPQVAFDFGEKSPEAGKIDAKEFAIRWEGGVIADETGDFEFRVTSANAVRLWLNDPDRPLIDARVRSGETTDESASVRLLAGRVYPIRLDLSKAEKNKDQGGTIGLFWRPPRRAMEVIPQRNLAPGWFPPVLVVETPLPPDDGSMGYERGTSVSASWDEATTYAAVEVAHKVLDDLPRWAKCPDDASDRSERLRQFAYRFAERAFRRPLDEEQRRFFVDQHFGNQPDPAEALKRTILLTLKSPRFLYPDPDPAASDGYAVAARMALALWDSLPDAPLLQAASQGKLHTPEEVAAQTRRMLADPRTRAKLREFFRRWLDVDRTGEVTKDQAVYPGFDQSLASDLVVSLDLFLDSVIWSENSDYRQLFLSNELPLNARLAEFYGAEVPEGGRFQLVALDPDHRAGLLTHPQFLANHSYYRLSSPIHRGVFLARNVLGRVLRPPPVAVAPLDEGVDPSLTTRERVALQTEPQSCQSCHSLINPLGFALENYDAVGRFRTEEKSKPIDAAGSFSDSAGHTTSFRGARELGEVLTQSDEVHAALVQQLFHHLVKQPALAYGPDTLEKLTASFVADECNVQHLLVEIVKVGALAGER